MYSVGVTLRFDVMNKLNARGGLCVEQNVYTGPCAESADALYKFIHGGRAEEN